MQISSRSGSVRVFVNALLLSSAAALVVVGCGGSSGGGGSSKAGATGDGDAGDSSGGSSGKGSGTGGKGSAGKGNTNAGGPTTGGEGGDMGEGGEAPVAQNHSAVAFVTGGVLSKSKNFVLVSGTGESLGGTVGSKQAKSLKYTYVPGVIAASAR